MPTFPRGFMNHRSNQANAEMIEKLCRETGGNIQVERAKQKFYAYTAADHHTLRGIPAIGPGVSGAVPGSKPEAVCNWGPSEAQS